MPFLKITISQSHAILSFRIYFKADEKLYRLVNYQNSSLFQ